MENNFKMMFIVLLITLISGGCASTARVQESNQATTVIEKTVSDDEIYPINIISEEQTITNETSISETEVYSQSIENEFFFKDISEKNKYNVQHSFFSEIIPPELSLQITIESQYEKGTLYKIKCDFTEDFPERYETGTDRLSLGYFYVPDNSNTIYRIREENMTDEVMQSEESVIAAGTIVCQEEELEDVLEEDEKGWHEWITADVDLREYHCYNNLTETGFYERFVWKRGYGLLYYTSGYGAERDMIELRGEANE